MSEEWYQKVEREAFERARAVMDKPMPETEDDIGPCDEDGAPLNFDPWELFPSLYGSYSSEFDDLAIEVLTELRDGQFGGRHDLAAEMFREMLCRAGLCDYGSSPRVCFPTTPFRALLPDLIEKWAAYRSARWKP